MAVADEDRPVGARRDGPQSHLAKAGTPTMGGALILVSIIVTTLLWGDLTNRFVWVVLLVTLGFGAVGWVDDWRKVVYRNPKGLSARWKFVWQSVIGLIAAIYLAFSVSAPDNTQFVRLIFAWCKAASPWGFRPRRISSAVHQDSLVSAGRLGLHRAHVLRDRGNEQRRQSHRRPGRPRDHADGHGRRRARHFRVRGRQRDLRALSGLPEHSRRGRTRRHLRCDRGRADSCGSTRIRRRVLGDVGALARARRSARSP